MYPKATTIKTQCLESLIGIRSQAAPGSTEPPFWLEDIEGLEVKKLAAIAKASNVSGKDFGQQLISSAAREMIGDIELLLNNGYGLQNILADQCSNCSLSPTYTTNTSLTISSNVASNYQQMIITKLIILANVSGTYELNIDDGTTIEKFNVVLTAGVLVPVKFNYITDQKTVQVYFTDATVPLGLVRCPTNSSCGCGGSASANNPIKFSGFLNGIASPNQYGFLPCVTITCSYNQLVCHIINATPNIFGLALLYKIGEKYYYHKQSSTRSNMEVSYGGEPGVEDDNKKNYGKLYWAKMQGGTDRKGIKNIINDFLKKGIHDKCIICNSKITTAYVTG
jgi:hypothetical protein